MYKQTKPKCTDMYNQAFLIKKILAISFERKETSDDHLVVECSSSETTLTVFAVLGVVKLNENLPNKSYS
jgi:hypothetical protein